jgi:ABC-type multidrug transport system fused ATPase/permease subunit
VDSLKRLIPFLTPYRGRLVFSVFLGLLVAALWGANITAVFPIVNLLLDRQPLKEQVAEKIAAAETNVADARADLDRIESKIAEVETEQQPEGESRLVKLLGDRARHENDLSSASRSLVTWKRVQLYILPLLPNDQFKVFALILGLLLCAELLKGVLVFGQDVLVGGVVQRVIMALRTNCLERVLALDYQTLAGDGTGNLMSRFTYDTEQVAMGVTLIGARLIREPLKALSCVCLALWINWRLTVMSLLFLPLLGLFLQWYGRTLKRHSQRMMESMSRIYKVLEETLEGMKIVIAFGTRERHRTQFHGENERFFHKSMRVVRVDAIAKPTMEVLGLLAMFLAMLPGAYLVIRGKEEIWGVQLSDGVMTAATLMTLYALLVGMLDPCRKMSSTFSRLKRCAAALDRIFQLIDRAPQVREATDPRPLPRLGREIEFSNVSFEYPARAAEPLRGPALQDVNLKVAAGEVVALVGQNGCGKSTLVSMLPRLYDPSHGSVLIDGVPIRDVRMQDLRAQIGLVTQETILFDDSIYENIRYGKPDATRGDVEEAARQAHVMEIVESVPHGFETPVGEKGKQLSGGQRQRIALARAIVRDPSILILDEATSATDAQSEALIHDALKSFCSNRTVFLITHAMTPGVLDLVTRIIVMDAGRILASGTHEQLLESCPLYQRLYSAKSVARAA